VGGDPGKRPFAEAAGKILPLLLETVIAYNDIVAFYTPLSFRTG